MGPMSEALTPDGPRRGAFLVLDGVDGCGKSTQARRLAARLAADRAEGDAEPLHLREPGSTPLGEELREIFLARRHVLSAEVEVLLLAAARRQMLDTVVGPALAEGRAVVCERFSSSTIAYQGFAGELGEERVERFLDDWASEPAPDLVIVLDVDADLARARRDGDRDRVEDRGEEFQARVAEGFRRYAGGHQRARLVDGTRDEDEVAETVWSAAKEVLDGRR